MAISTESCGPSRKTFSILGTEFVPDADELPVCVWPIPLSFAAGGGLIQPTHLVFVEPSPPGGDVNGDGVVDVDDLLQVLLLWGVCPGCSADLDGNGVVDVDDLVLVFVNWT